MKIKDAVLAGALALLPIFSSDAIADAVSGQGTWESTLLGRDQNGKPVEGSSAEAVMLYDKTLNVTWLRDANANGLMTWLDAVGWANNLRIGEFGGWRLPATTDLSPPGCPFQSFSGTDCGYRPDPQTSEMAHLYTVTLGNVGLGEDSPPEAWQPPHFTLTNTGFFENLQPQVYWSGTSCLSGNSPNNAWVFATYYGAQACGDKNSNVSLAMAVRDGDVAAPIPEPETYAMMLAGLGLLGVVARRRKQQQASD